MQSGVFCALRSWVATQSAKPKNVIWKVPIVVVVSLSFSLSLSISHSLTLFFAQWSDNENNSGRCCTNHSAMPSYSHPCTCPGPMRAVPFSACGFNLYRAWSLPQSTPLQCILPSPHLSERDLSHRRHFKLNASGIVLLLYNHIPLKYRSLLMSQSHSTLALFHLLLLLMLPLALICFDDSTVIMFVCCGWVDAFDYVSISVATALVRDNWQLVHFMPDFMSSSKFHPQFGRLGLSVWQLKKMKS